MTTTASTSSNSAPLSRFARISAGLGLKSLNNAGPSRQTRQYTDANESEWYIPYNGPYEPPKSVSRPGTSKDRDGDGGNWVGQNNGAEHDPFERDKSVAGHGASSASGHGHGVGSIFGIEPAPESYYEDDRKNVRSRAFSAASVYSEDAAIPGNVVSNERRSNWLSSPTASAVSPKLRTVRSISRMHNTSYLDTSVGIGESPVPAQRISQAPNHILGHASGSGHGHGHDANEHLLQAHAHNKSGQAVSPVSPRDSFASFWTFGRSANKKAVGGTPSVYSGGRRPSIETHFSRPSTSTRNTAAQGTATGQPFSATRDRSATVGGAIHSGTDTSEAENATPRSIRPRANTTSQPGILKTSTSAPQMIRTANSAPVVSVDPSEQVSDGSAPSYQRHPYATASPPTGHREHSRYFPSQKRPTMLNLTVPFLSQSKSFASLKKSNSNLKSSVSTPNLRGSSGGKSNMGSASNSPSTPSATSSKWLSAETWCDALLFPRPRFRMRSAHVISPPGSPVGGAPPHSAPAQPRSLKRSIFGGKQHTDTRKSIRTPPSAPPVFVHPASSPSQMVAGPSNAQPKPSRSKPFAQDDLAIPSPIPSLATVLKQNEEFDEERKQWKAQASKSFQNKRSRSLSKSRMRSKTRLKDPGIENELATSFDKIAATAFHGNQNIKPSILVADTSTGSKSAIGTNTTSSHSRNTSNVSQGVSSKGHSRKESWSTTALKSAKSVKGLCVQPEDLSPADERIIALDHALEKNRTKYVKAAEGRSNNEDVVVIAPGILVSPSPKPSIRSADSTNHTGVGIALSTPTVFVEQQFQFSEHPYASSPTVEGQNLRPSNYAGPHPSHTSKVAEHNINDSTLSDMNERHRMPVASSQTYSSTLLHPYAAVEARHKPTLQVPRSGAISPPKRMFADIGTGMLREVLPEEIQYSPYSVRYTGNSRGSSNRNSDALGVEEALNMAFSRGEVRDKSNESRERNDSAADEFGREANTQELLLPPNISITHKTEPILHADDDSVLESWQGQDDVVPDVSNHRTPVSGFSFIANSSPGVISMESSPMTSPRLFKKFDDMEDYSDLFYRPGQSQNQTPQQQEVSGSGHHTPSNEAMRVLNSREESRPGSDKPMLARSNSALTNLRRQLSEEYGANDETQHLERGFGVGRPVGEAVTEMDEDVDDAHAMLSQGSSPPVTVLPLRVQMSRPLSSGPTILIPEDVESSRASSILERYEGEDGTDIFYRVREVPALSTPDPIISSNGYRASAHVSYIGDDNTIRDDEREHSPQDRLPRSSELDTFFHPSRPSLVPPNSGSGTDNTRASYLTSASSTSRISHLSDFPVPPGQNALTPGGIINSYFNTSTPDVMERNDPLVEPVIRDQQPQQRRELRASRRTTFGPVEDDVSIKTDHS